LAYERRKQGCTGCDLVTTEVKDFLFNDDLKVDGSRIDLIRFPTLIDKAPGTFAIVTK
jgi:hypothetical protein